MERGAGVPRMQALSEAAQRLGQVLLGSPWHLVAG